MPVWPTVALSVQLSAGVWTAITSDVVGRAGVRLRYGIQANGPADCLATTGECSFQLRNDAANSGSAQGWYSPVHVSKRAGWTFGIPFRAQFTYSAVTYTKFRGKVRVIRPMPGTGRGEKVDVVAYDGMGDLMDADVREVGFQTSKTEAQLLTTLLDSLPTDAQPVARDLNTGIDTYPYAFDNIGGGVKAAGLMKDVIASAYGLGFFKGDGTFAYRNRHTRATGSSAFTFTNTMHGLVVPSSLDKVYNRVRVTIHPKTVDAAATTVLASQTGTAPDIASGASITVWLNFRDPDDTKRLIGGTATVTPVATTDYTANDAADGTGTDRTGSITVTATAFASSVKFVITNNHTGTVYLTKLQLRGKGVYDDGPRTFEKYTASTYGDRPIAIDMPYQDDHEIGQNAASYVYYQYNSLTNQIETIEFVANQSDALMVQALTREPGDIITVTETVTGLSSTKAVIHSVELELGGGGHLICRWGLAPAAPFTFFQWGIPGAAEWGQSTVWGF